MNRRKERGSDAVAYLTGEYPIVSHTFIQREIAAVREAGLTVVPFAIRPTGPEHLTGPEERAAAKETFYVLAVAKNPVRLLSAHAACFLRTPGRYLRTLALAFEAGGPGGNALIWRLFYFAEAGVLAQALRARRVRHIHNHFADSSCTVAMLAAELADLPFSFTMHGPTEFFEAHRWRLDLKIARSQFVACISQFCRSQMMIFSSPAHWDKLRIVHCGVTPDRYDRRTDRRDDGHLHILAICRLTPLKGVSVLLKALAQIAASAAVPSVQLVVVGDGPAREDLERDAAAYGLAQRVTFTGYRSQDEVAAHLDEADLFILPSFAEGVPVVLMEAMASSVPVIATRVGGVAELVEDGVSGLLVAPSDVEGLAAAIVRLAADPALRRRMGAAGRAKVEAEFVSRQEARRLAALFAGEVVIDGHKAGA